MGKASREKGARWERELAVRLQAIFPTARRGIGQCRAAGEVADVDIPLLWVEAKVGRHCYPRKALEQAAAAAPLGRIPVAVCRDDRKAPTATMSLDDLEFILRNWITALRRAGSDFPQERLEEPQPQLELVPPIDRDAWGNP